MRRGTLTVVPGLALVGRIHHRSGGYGLFADAGGSNFVTLGLRRRF